MRTKATILAAAIVAAGVASSMAQSNVYSLNVVGYVNLTLQPGYNLISLPLQSSDATSSINSVLTNTTPTVPFGAFVSTWNPSAATYASSIYAGGDGNWYDPTFNYLQTNSLPPGEAFFVFLPKVSAGGVPSLTVTVVGTVLQGTNAYPENTGYGFYANFEPVAGDITTNGFPITKTGSFLNEWNFAGQTYASTVYGVTASDNGTTYPAFYDPTFSYVIPVVPAVGQGFVYYNSGSSASWTQSFTVQ